jgi:hypothetical protein
MICNPKKLLLLFILAFALWHLPVTGQQAVTGVVTDYQGYWKTAIGQINTLKPQGSHNLLAFTYNNIQYSTGVNDGALSNQNENFVPGDFWCLPIANISGNINSNTKVGLGQLYDGVHNGASNPAPDGDIITYLTDGIKGLNIGTCIANLPAGTMSFFVSNIKPQQIGDGVPDILVTQVADPSSSFDRYAFTNEQGQVIGVTKDIVFTNITPIATWTVDFYEASQNPMALASDFTNTDRPMRLWAADLADFGINQQNYSQIQRFQITLSGNSDVAFAAYNNNTFTINSNVLPVSWQKLEGHLMDNKASLVWETASESNSDYFMVEKQTGASSFREIGRVEAAGNSSGLRRYQFLDPNADQRIQLYRIKLVDQDGRQYSSPSIVLRQSSTNGAWLPYPNPAKNHLTVKHSYSITGMIRVYNSSGYLMLQQRASTSQNASLLHIGKLPPGIYQLQYQTSVGPIQVSFIKQ